MRIKEVIMEDSRQSYGDKNEQIELFLEVLIDIRDILKGLKDENSN